MLVFLWIRDTKQRTIDTSALIATHLPRENRMFPRFFRRTPFNPTSRDARITLLTAIAACIALHAAPTGAQNATEPSTASTAAVTAPAELASPRATMRTFLESLAEGDLDTAASTLDLTSTGLSERLRRLRGPELAVRLKNAVDRVRLVDYNDIPDTTEGEPYVFWSGRTGVIEIAQGDEGAWRFSPRTIEKLNESLDELADHDMVEGVVEAPQTRSEWLRARMPEALLGPGFILEHWQWMVLGALVVLGVGIDLVARWLLFAVVSRRLRRSISVDTARINRALRPFGLLAMAMLWWFALGWLGLPDRPLAVLGTAVEIVAVAGAIWGLYRLIDLVVAFLEARAEASPSKLDDMLVPLFERSAKIFVLVFGLIFLADSLRVPITSLLAGVGIGGIALALAAQDLVKNLFGSLTVLLDRPFEIDDYIAVSGVEGTVEEVAFRSTRIRTPADTVVTLPNANLISASVENFGRRRFRRWRSHIGLAYDTPTLVISTFCERLRTIILEREDTRKEGFFAELNNLGASSLEVLFQVYFEVPGQADELRGRHQLAVAILDLAEELGIEIAFPTQTIHVQTKDGSSAAGE